MKIKQVTLFIILFFAAEITYGEIPFIKYTTTDDELRGKPYYVNTYTANLISDWGEVSLQRGSLRDSISYDRNGLRTYVEVEPHVFGTNSLKCLSYFYTGDRPDSIVRSHVDLDEIEIYGKRYYPEDLYSFNWIGPDSVTVNLIKDIRENSSRTPSMQWRYRLTPTFRSLTYFKDRWAEPRYMATKTSNGQEINMGNGDDFTIPLGDGIDDSSRSGFHNIKGFNYNSKYSLHYDNNNRVIRKTSAPMEKEYLEYWHKPLYSKTDIKYEYNQQGDIVKISKNNEIVTTYEYKYDDTGNWIYRKEINPRRSYDKETYLVREIMYYDSPEYNKKIEQDSIREANKVYNPIVVDSRPEFIGEDFAETKWLYNAPWDIDKLSGNNHSVSINVVVEKDGSLSDIRTDRGINSDSERFSEYREEFQEMFKEIERVIGKMPEFTPAYKNGKKVRCEHSIRIPVYDIIRKIERDRELEQERQQTELWRQQRINELEQLIKTSKKADKKRYQTELDALKNNERVLLRR